MIRWLYFPKSDRPSKIALAVVNVFEGTLAAIDSTTLELKSNEVLAQVAPRLKAAGFKVELGKGAKDRIRVPVLFGLNGRLEKAFDADAYHEKHGFVVEIE